MLYCSDSPPRLGTRHKMHSPVDARPSDAAGRVRAVPADGGERLRQVVEHGPGRHGERVGAQLDHSSVVSERRRQRRRWRSAEFRARHQMAVSPLLRRLYSVPPGELDHRHFPFQVKGVVRGSFLGNAVDADADAGPVPFSLEMMEESSRFPGPDSSSGLPARSSSCRFSIIALPPYGERNTGRNVAEGDKRTAAASSFPISP
ncbi:hypothetical protein EYF80_049478 [Liparis tanakae]|uniref:Uncharacterized protein n=1 Tax=Liparis tanakae TaxID=230148 RepID=A0A4Z2FHF1_9TELE|nr:hypothetical protein EYF80_049478 [Liparis tanakae]